MLPEKQLFQIPECIFCIQKAIVDMDIDKIPRNHSKLDINSAAKFLFALAL